MAIAFVQSVQFQGDAVNSVQVILPNVVAGNFLSIQDQAFLASAEPAPSDDKLNTWNATTVLGGGGVLAHVSYAMNVAVGTTTVTMDYGTGFYCGGSGNEFSGMATSSALDVQTENTGTSTTPTSGTTGSTAQNDELILVAVGVDVNDTNVGLDVPATTGYTNLSVEQNAQLHVGHSTDYKIVAATGVQSAAWGTIVSANWAGKIATFTAPVALPPGPTTAPSLNNWIGGYW
jgi:hypothetical protein